MEVPWYRHGRTGHFVPLAGTLRCRWIRQCHCGWLDRNVQQPSRSRKLARWPHTASLVRTAQWSVRRDRHFVSVHSLLRRCGRGRRTPCFDRSGGRRRDLDRSHQRVHGQSRLRRMHSGGAMLGERGRIIHDTQRDTGSWDNRLPIAGCELRFERLLRDGHWRTDRSCHEGRLTQSLTSSDTCGSEATASRDRGEAGGRDNLQASTTCARRATRPRISSSSTSVTFPDELASSAWMSSNSMISCSTGAWTVSPTGWRRIDGLSPGFRLDPKTTRWIARIVAGFVDCDR